MHKKALKNLIRVMTLVLAFVMLLSLAACGSKSTSPAAAAPDAQASGAETKNAAAPITITFPTLFVGENSMAPWFSTVLARFNAEYGDQIHVQIEEIPGDQAYLDKMKILLASGDLPDVIFGINIMDLAVQQNAYVDLTPYLDADPAWKATISEAGLEFNSRNGKVYGIPSSVNYIGYFYNKELFAKAGIDAPAETWDEFWANCDKLKAAGITPMSQQTGEDAWTTMLLFSALVGTDGEAGNKFMNTVNPTDYNIPEVINAFAKIKDVLQNYTTADAIGGGYENAAVAFETEQTAMMFNGTWMISEFNDPGKTADGFAAKIGAAAFPNGIISTPNIGYSVGSKDKEHADAAVTFIKFITSLDSQELLLTMGGVLPESPALDLSDDVVAQQPILAELLQSGNKVQYQFMDYQMAWYTNTLDVLGTELSSLYYDLITPEELAQMMTEAALKNLG